MAIRNLSSNNIQPGALLQPEQNDQTHFPQTPMVKADLSADNAAINHLTDNLDNSFLVASIKPGEIGWGVASPPRALIGSRAADVATNTANMIFAALDPGRRHSPDDNERNAFKHAYWNALMVKNFATYESAQRGGGGDLNTRLMRAAVWARRFADAHEQDIPFNPANTQAQHNMDFHNNRAGREIAIRVLRQNPNASDNDLADAVMSALRRGQLSVLKREYPRPF